MRTCSRVVATGDARAASGGSRSRRGPAGDHVRLPVREGAPHAVSVPQCASSRLCSAVRFVLLRRTGGNRMGSVFLALSCLEGFDGLREGSGFVEAVPGADAVDGIVTRIRRECDGNVADRGVVYVTAKTEHAPRRAVNPADTDAAFLSDNEPGQWLCLAFQ